MVAPNITQKSRLKIFQQILNQMRAIRSSNKIDLVGAAHEVELEFIERIENLERDMAKE